MAARLRAFSVATWLMLVFMLLPGTVFAQQSIDSTYGFDRTWNCGMRLIRVDLGLKITEKDEPSGFITFDYLPMGSEKRSVPGSLEFIRGTDGSVRVLVTIAKMPSHHEQVIADALGRKLRQDYGDPPRKAPSVPATPVTKDGGADS